ncbi:MAG: hypothetical protein GY715_05355 [Planctomycetes bacterium]|nr:hypothetical protein [Planctomycetota bacterium]
MSDTSLPRDLVDRPRARTYKADERSVVWLAREPEGAWVIKLYEYAPIRQTLARMIGIHPAQRETRLNRRLRADGLAVVPIAGDGARGGRVWLATPECGEALQIMIQQGQPASRAERNRLIDAAVDLWLALVQAGWFFRDFQVANILVDDDGRPWLIDVGATRRSPSREHALRMLRQLHETAVVEGLTRTDAWRGARRVARKWGMLASARDVAAALA